MPLPSASGAHRGPDDFAERYVAHQWLAYLHIAPGVVYLLGAPLQLSRRFRMRHYDVHRRVGRLLVTSAIVAGLFALAFGVPHAWGSAPESAPRRCSAAGAWLASFSRSVRSGATTCGSTAAG